MHVSRIAKQINKISQLHIQIKTFKMTKIKVQLIHSFLTIIKQNSRE